MNPISGMLAEAQLAYSIVVPIFKTASNVATHLPTVETKLSTLVDKLTKVYGDFRHVDLASAKADIGEAWAAGAAVYDEVAIARVDVQGAIAKAQAAPSPDALGSVLSAGEAIAKKLGLPV